MHTIGGEQLTITGVSSGNPNTAEATWAWPWLGRDTGGPARETGASETGADLP